MKTTLLIAFILCADMISAQWTRIINSPFRAEKIYFFNAQTGYALKNDTIFKSTDGGTTWNDLPNSFNPYTQINDIRFISPDTGLIYVTEAISFAYPVSIYRTTNGGQSWSSILGPYDGSDISFHMAAQNDWYFHVTSQWLSPATDSIIHTVNGGNSFTKTGNTNTVQYNQVTNNLILYKDSTSSNQENLFYKSTDGGASWTLLLTDSTADASFMDRQFLSSSNGYVLLYQYNATDNIESKIYKTTNGGQNWISYDLPAAITAPQDMHFADISTGYIISNASGHSEIFKTINGGQTWALDFSGNANEYFTWYMGMAEYFGKLYVLGNSIITNQAATSVEDLKNNELSFGLYPNPSTGLLTIKNNFPDKPTDFVIMDITGKEVYAFSTEQSISHDIDVSFLSNGLYLLKQRDKSQSILFVKE
ncbi:MAG: hypothetical protein K0S53_191 [Bacteroidetes bacterium]|jgi:photosystem II stability/assembly factor-like uncharacterized protein|nr:hypothetical protein [Bacteroidota bacterium]MDF2452682.1 hypothetical protein [Bacteroidota bacterium]